MIKLNIKLREVLDFFYIFLCVVRRGVPLELIIMNYFIFIFYGAQWLSGRVLDSRPRGRRFEPHRRHCVVVLEQDAFILA